MKFLKDIKLYDEFEEFIEDEYNEELDKIIGKEKKLMNVKDLEEEKNKMEKLREELDKLKLKEIEMNSKEKDEKDDIKVKGNDDYDDDYDDEQDYSERCNEDEV